MVKEKYPELWERAKSITKTCPLNDIQDGCLTFAKDLTNVERLSNIKKKFDVIIPSFISRTFPDNITVHRVEHVKKAFIELHNKINADKNAKINEIHPTSIVHPTAVIGVPGNNIMKTSEGRIVNMKHMGNVVLEEYTEVQALSVIHRAAFGSTIIRKNAQIFAKVNIGHNCDIGESTIVCPGTMLAGGTKVGKNCYIWQGVITRSNISICDNVVIGAGSLVMKNIYEPGVYFGSPVKYIKPYSEELR